MATDLQITARKVASVNPATGEVLRELECAGQSEVDAAVARARVAQMAWAGIGVRRRIAVLREFQRRLLEKKSEIAEAITCETGKPVAEALTTEVLVVLDAARFLIENAYRRMEVLPPSSRADGWYASPTAWWPSFRRGIIRFRFLRRRRSPHSWRGMRWC